MTPSAKTTKMLWGRAAARCSMPDCRNELVLDETETDDEALIGEMCHMVAESEAGPRGTSSLTVEQRNLYGNLVLLCRNHHREIDTQWRTYPIERLRQIKADHEAWVRRSLPGYDSAKQRDDELYAGYIDEWERRCDLDYWTAWSSWVLSAQPYMSVELDKQLYELRRWLLVRAWPGRYSTLEKALENFRQTLSDFQNVFREHAELPDPDSTGLYTAKFYQIREWDKERYDRLLKDYEYHVDLVADLMLELTRAANLICDEVRAQLLPSFRLKEGRLSVQSGPDVLLRVREMVVQYNQEERLMARPYPGLTDFMAVRASRDYHFGEGVRREFDPMRPLLPPEK